MRVLFVDNLLIEQRGASYHFDLQPHLGLISLLAVVENAGHEGVLVDPKLAVSGGRLSLDSYLYERLADEILLRSPDLVGMTSLGCNFICTLKVAGYLKRRNPTLPIILGGPHATILDSAIIEDLPQFDVIVRNEAELTLPVLLTAMSGAGLSEVPGITYRRSGRAERHRDGESITDLDALPWAAYKHYPIMDLGLTSLRVEAGRGCPFACTFCSTASFFGRRYRLKSAKRLCAELDQLHDAYGISHFSLTHDLFTVNKAKVREFCDTVESRGYTWGCSARMDCVDAQLLDRMSEAGCRSIYYGVETGSRRMQKLVAKRLDLALVRPVLTQTRDAGMEATASFITGYPQEEPADQFDTLDLIGEIWQRQPTTVKIQLHLLTPEPGTGLLNQFRNALDYDGHISDFNFPTLEPDDSDIMRGSPDIFVNHHYYRGVLPRERNVLVTSVHQLLYRLGYPVQRHLLGHYGGSLSRWFGDMVAWADNHQMSAPFDARFLCAFMRATWGDHYVVSLVRYMLAATDPSRGCDGRHYQLLPDRTRRDGGDSPPSATAASHYQVAPGVAVLRDLHACPAIIDVLEASDAPESAVIPENLRNGHAHYMLLPSPDALAIRNFIVNEETATLLEFLDRPRSTDDVATMFRLPPGRDLNLHALFEDLCKRRVLTYGTPRREITVGERADIHALATTAGHSA